MIASLALFALTFATGGAAAAPPQEPAFAVAPAPNAAYRPRLLTEGVLADPALEQAVRSGLPLRLRFRVELWRDRFFDELVEGESWTAVVFYDPLAERFGVRPRAGARPIHVDSYADARLAVEHAYTLTLRPRRPGRYYYTAALEIETLSLSDLEELENWLHGELRPAVRGEGSVPQAVGAGVKRLFIRVLGLAARRHEARSGVFRLSAAR